MTKTITISTLDNKLRRKAIKLTAQYYCMDYKLQGKGCYQWAILTQNKNSIIEDDDMILEAIKEQYRVLKEHKNR